MTAEAGWAAALFAVDPVGLGGIALRADAGPTRDAWLTGLRALLPDGSPWRRLPPNTADERLLGGLDLPATLRTGRPVAAMGLLAEADGGVVVLPMAERLPPGTAARLAAVLDAGTVTLERDGLARRFPVALGLVALDEGIAPDEGLSPALLDPLRLPRGAGPARRRCGGGHAGSRGSGKGMSAGSHGAARVAAGAGGDGGGAWHHLGACPAAGVAGGTGGGSVGRSGHCHGRGRRAGRTPGAGAPRHDGAGGSGPGA